MALTTNKHVLDWIDEMAALTKPDSIVWIDGSKAQLAELRKLAVESIIMNKCLCMEVLPSRIT